MKTIRLSGACEVVPTQAQTTMYFNRAQPRHRHRLPAPRSLLLALFLLALPPAIQAQFTYTTDNGTITITRYTGPGGAVAIPGAINGLPVTPASEALRSLDVPA
jgi:hypothetical protein